MNVTKGTYYEKLIDKCVVRKTQIWGDVKVQPRLSSMKKEE